tara:strand:- start:6830 stop:7855 length:1026 start_codon:yes stop_codon:yes gene_type:complete
MIILVTGAAGFIGFNLCKKLLNKSNVVIGIDNINPYYDVNLKEARLNILKEVAKETDAEFYFFKNNLEDSENLKIIFKKFRPEYVVNLAAQAGVRYSLENPKAYLDSNIIGFTNILEECKENKIKHLLYASSSSVYGGNKNMPFSEAQNAVHPVSLYAATKRANELLAHTYSHLYNLPATGLRFFTVYGPWGRPDMALFLFTKSILDDKPIKVFNNGDMLRDFTYVDDVVESLLRLILKIPVNNDFFNRDEPDPSSSWAPHKIFNIGNSKPVKLMDYISAIEKAIGKKGRKEYLPMQPGDVKETMSDSSELEKWIDFRPNTDIEEGIKNFVEWFKDFYKYN